MLRFMPDSLIEGLLRPFTMADPVGGVYLEMIAPDWRFAIFLTLMTLAFATRRAPALVSPAHRATVFGLLPLLYCWTFVSGNGRYFIWALLVIGPLVVLACRLLPGSRSLRATVLALVLLLQGYTVYDAYMPAQWGLSHWGRWSEPIAESPLRHRPAVFLTISGPSYSILVPWFHPQSRWANVAGQGRIRPGTHEHRQLQALLATPLPQYLVLPMMTGFEDEAARPEGDVRALIDAELLRIGLQLAGSRCEALRSRLIPSPPESQGGGRRPSGVWVCPLEPGPLTAGREPSLSPEQAAVFSAIEQRCPRFFPPGNNTTSARDGLVLRSYLMTDVYLYVEDSGRVMYKHLRSLNPILVARVEQVIKGDFTLACDKIVGRYEFPWHRD